MWVFVVDSNHFERIVFLEFYPTAGFLTGTVTMIKLQLLQPFITSLFLGALIGFEREFSTKVEQNDDLLGGIRTFSLVALFGSLASFLGEKVGPSFLVAALGGLIALTVISYLISFYKFNERGITTEVSMLLTFFVGIAVHQGHVVAAVFVALAVTVVLHLKESINKISGRVEHEDIRAILKFAIITFIILIIDSNFTFYIKDIGPLAQKYIQRYPEILDVPVVNPYNVWVMVVLISGIGFTGYIAIKILGQRRGIGITGFLGGLVSSTATTMTFSKRSREVEASGGDNTMALPFALAVLLACSTMFPRILTEVLIINADLLPGLSVTMGSMALAGFTVCLVLWRKTAGEESEGVPLKNPFSIMPAVQFGLLYAVIVFVTRLLGKIVGDSGFYIVSVLSGLTDVDAITLTMSQIARDDPAKAQQAVIAITLASFSNTFLKGGMAFVLGSKKMRRIVLVGFGITIAVGIAALVAVNTVL